jgi:hypothetical protein
VPEVAALEREPATLSDVDGGIEIDDLDDDIELDRGAAALVFAAAAIAAPPAPAVSAPVPVLEDAFAPAIEVDVPVDWLVGAATDRFNLKDILASEADSLILGDASDIVGSIKASADPMSIDINDILSPAADQPAAPPPMMSLDELMVQPPAAPTPTPATPPAADLPRRGSLQVFLGGDVARLLGSSIVLRRRSSTVDTAGLSPFEKFVLQHVDGTRTVADVQAAMRVSEGDLRIVLALLLDKRLVEGSSLTPAAAAPTEAFFAPTPARAMPAAAEPIVVEPSVEELLAPRSPMPTPFDNNNNNTPPPSSSPAFGSPPPPAFGSAPSAFGSPAPAFGAPAFGSAPAGSASMWKSASSSSSSSSPTSPPPAFAPAFGAKPMGLPGQGPPLSSLSPPPSSSSSSSSSSSAGRPAAPASMSPGAAALRAGLLIAGDHGKAASLHAQCIKELKNGTVERAHQLARQALNAAPDMTLYRDTLAEWPAFVAAHRTPDDVRFKAQAITAEEGGDFDKAVALLRQSVAANPQNASSWNRLAVLLATKKADIDGAMEAAQKALEVAPNDATYLSNFTKFAAIADKAAGGIDKKARGMWNRLLGK